MTLFFFREFYTLLYEGDDWLWKKYLQKETWL